MNFSIEEPWAEKSALKVASILSTAIHELHSSALYYITFSVLPSDAIPTKLVLSREKCQDWVFLGQ